MPVIQRLNGRDVFERTQQQLMSQEPHAKARSAAVSFNAVPKVLRSRPRSLKHWLNDCPTREEALRCACVQSGIGMTQLAKEIGLTVSRLSQLIARAEKPTQTKAE